MVVERGKKRKNVSRVRFGFRVWFRARFGVRVGVKMNQSSIKSESVLREM